MATLNGGFRATVLTTPKSTSEGSSPALALLTSRSANTIDPRGMMTPEIVPEQPLPLHHWGNCTLSIWYTARAMGIIPRETYRRCGSRRRVKGHTIVDENSPISLLSFDPCWLCGNDAVRAEIPVFPCYERRGIHLCQVARDEREASLETFMGRHSLWDWNAADPAVGRVSYSSHA